MGDNIEPESTIGVWVGEDDVRDIEAFDRYFRSTEGAYSRSAEIKRAMNLHVVVEEALGQVDADIPDREVHALLRSLIYQEFDE